MRICRHGNADVFYCSLHNRPIFYQHQPMGSNYNSNKHLMQHLYCAAVAQGAVNPEPPKGVGKEGVGNSSTDLVSVQDWQPLLNP